MPNEQLTEQPIPIDFPGQIAHAARYPDLQFELSQCAVTYVLAARALQRAIDSGDNTEIALGQRDRALQALQAKSHELVNFLEVMP